MTTKILDDAYQLDEEWAGIIYSVDNDTEAIVHTMGDWSVVESVWNGNQPKYQAIEHALADYGEHYYLLKLPATDPELPGLHNVSRLEGYLISNGIHPLHRTKRLPK